MDDSDLECIDKYLNAVLDVVRASAGRVRAVRITWKYLSDGSTLPELEIDLIQVPDAEPVL